MIELKERYYRLIKKLEKDNCSKYKVYEIDDRYYIDVDTLLDVLDDTEDNRVYAEEKVKEVCEDYDTRIKENGNSLQLITIEELNRVKEENIILRRELMNVCNEDSYDRLAFEGVEL